MIKSNLNSWCSGDEGKQALWNNITRATPHFSETPAKALTIKRTKKLVSHGRFKDAVKMLTSNGLAPINQSTIDLLRLKHPASHVQELALPTTPLTPALIVTPEQVKQAIQSFPKGTAAGRDGFRAQYFCDMLNGPSSHDVENFINYLTTAINNSLAGKDLEEPALQRKSANLFPLNAKSDIRPIAIGEIYRRLVSKLAVRTTRNLFEPYLYPLQVGVGTRNGVEGIIHSINNLLEDESAMENQILLKIDFANAFNSIHRDAMLKEVADHVPAIYPWVKHCYSTAPMLYINKGNSNFTEEELCIVSDSGVQQGDPLGPLLFALTLQKVLLAIKNDPGCSNLILNAWFLDDGTLMGPASDIHRAIEVIHTVAPPLGLTMNNHKCEILQLSPTIIAHPPVIFSSEIPWVTKGTKLLGSYIGSKAEASLYAMKRVNTIDDIVSKLDSLEDAQVQYHLLKNCILMPKMSYALKTLHPNSMTQVYLAFDNIIKKALVPLIGTCSLSENLFERICLPLNQSGAGLHSASNLAWPSYLGSHMNSSSIQADILSYKMSAVLANHKVETKINVLKLNFQELFNNNSLLSTNSSALKGPQRLLSNLVHESIFQKFINESDSPRDVALAIACKEKKADWLQAAPFSWLHQTMSSQQWRIMFRYRFGIPVYSKAISCPCCTQWLDIYGQHAVSCAGSARNAGSCRTNRHNAVRDTLFFFAKEAKLPIEKEKKDLCIDNSAKPADIYIPSFRDNHLDLCVDVTICNSMPQDGSNRIFNPLDPFNMAENAKKDKYALLRLKHDNILVPFVMGSLGGFNQDAEHLIDEFGKAKFLSSNNSFSASYFSTMLRRSLSFIVQKYQANAMINRGTGKGGTQARNFRNNFLDDNILLVSFLFIKLI